MVIAEIDQVLGALGLESIQIKIVNEINHKIDMNFQINRDSVPDVERTNIAEDGFCYRKPGDDVVLTITLREDTKGGSM